MSQTTTQTYSQVAANTSSQPTNQPTAAGQPASQSNNQSTAPMLALEPAGQPSNLQQSRPIALRRLATEHFMKSRDNVESARRELLGLDIKTSYDEHVMIFHAMHRAKNTLTSVYAQECNGLILEQKTWRPLVVPPQSLRFNIDNDASTKFLHRGLYHIYKAQDGTCFNLYYYQDQWVVSTARGYYMNDTKWDSNLTYIEVITDCLSKIGLSWETFTAQLNKTHCYSFGFKHPNFHKFFEGTGQPIYAVWFIQSVDLDQASNSYLWTSDQSPIAIINGQERYSEPISSLRELYKMASCSLDNFLENKTVCYGFILRSVNIQQTGFHSDLYVESALMRYIRNFWYENRFIDMCHSNGWPKEKVLSLIGYLDSDNYETFRVLFSQYTDVMEHYSNVIQSVVNNMIDAVKIRPTDGTTRASTPYTVAADYFLQTFKKKISYNLNLASSEQLRKIFSEYICSIGTCNAESLGVLLTVIQ